MISGAVKSIGTVALTIVSLPAISVILISALASPCATVPGISTVKSPPTPTVVVKLNSLASESIRVTLITVPSGSEHVPVIDGKLALTSMSPSLSNVMTGSVRSIGTVAFRTVSLPAKSVTLITAEASPSAAVAGMTTVNNPSIST